MRVAEKKVENLEPFNEIIVSFNAIRPQVGHYLISVSLFEKEWTGWKEYVYWSATEQKSFSGSFENSSFIVDQDVVSSKEGFATGFRVKVDACDGADLDGFANLIASIARGFEKTVPAAGSVNILEMEGVSQLRQEERYAKRICAGTSTSAAVGYLVGRKYDTVEFALGAYDGAFDVFGNWVFNVARAYEKLGKDWKCWVERLRNLDELLHQLKKGIPVVVSVKGRLPGSFMPYENGHLMVVIGYDGENREVICMDPAYPEHDQTIVRYPVVEFLEAWGARKGLALMFASASNDITIRTIGE